MLDRLEFPHHKNPRWCSDNHMDKALKTNANFYHKSKFCAESFIIHPCPTNIGPKFEANPVKSKGVAVDRCNSRFLDNINSGEKLTIAIGYQT